MTEEPSIIEYKLRPVTRFIVTRFEGHGPGGAGCNSAQVGPEYANEDIAFEVAYALCKQEHNRLGWPIDDCRIQYPSRLDLTKASASPVTAVAG